MGQEWVGGASRVSRAPQIPPNPRRAPPWEQDPWEHPGADPSERDESTGTPEVLGASAGGSSPSLIPEELSCPVPAGGSSRRLREGLGFPAVLEEETGIVPYLRAHNKLQPREFLRQLRTSSSQPNPAPAAAPSGPFPMFEGCRGLWGSFPPLSGEAPGVFRVLELLPSRRRPGGRQRGQVGLGPGFPKSCKSIPWGASGEEPPSAAASGASPSRISLKLRGMCRETSPHLSPGIKKPQIPVFPTDLISGSPLGALPEPGPSRDGGTGAGLEDGAGNWLLCPQERELMPGTGAPERSRSSRSPSAPGCLP